MSKPTMTDRFAQEIKSATGCEVSPHQLQDILWTLYTNPEMMKELNHFHRDWLREMNENH